MNPVCEIDIEKINRIINNNRARRLNTANTEIPPLNPVRPLSICLTSEQFILLISILTFLSTYFSVSQANYQVCICVFIFIIIGVKIPDYQKLYNLSIHFPCNFQCTANYTNRLHCVKARQS